MDEVDDWKGQMFKPKSVSTIINYKAEYERESNSEDIQLNESSKFFLLLNSSMSVDY